MDPQNIETLREIFNWYELNEITEVQIHEISERLNYPLGEDFQLKSSWGYFKKYEVLSLDEKPILFLKYVREKYFEEVLGVHLTRYFLDENLGFKEYMTGVFYKKKNKAIPYLATSFESGNHIGNYDISHYKYQLGRQCVLHEILSLYDVYDRHFIVRKDNSVCRIDFGRCFENMHKKFLGFQDFLNRKKVDFYDEEFQRGYQTEKEVIRNNIKGKKRDLIQIIAKIKELTYDKVIIFDVDRFANRIIDHWSRIGFLKEADVENIQWI